MLRAIRSAGAAISAHERPAAHAAAGTPAAAQAQEEMVYVRALWHEIRAGYVHLKNIDEPVSQTLGTLSVDAKGICDAVERTEAAVLSMTDKGLDVDGLSSEGHLEANQDTAEVLAL